MYSILKTYLNLNLVLIYIKNIHCIVKFKIAVANKQEFAYQTHATENCSHKILNISKCIQLKWHMATDCTSKINLN